MATYLDSSAMAKLIVQEVESDSLRDWLRQRGSEPRVTNVVGAVEVQRLAARVGRAAAETAVLVLARIGRLELTPAALALAVQMPPPEVRSLDALHIASAAAMTDLSWLVTYDHRMAYAAAAYGLAVASPGR